MSGSGEWVCFRGYRDEQNPASASKGLKVELGRGTSDNHTNITVQGYGCLQVTLGNALKIQRKEGSHLAGVEVFKGNARFGEAQKIRWCSENGGCGFQGLSTARSRTLALNYGRLTKESLPSRGLHRHGRLPDSGQSRTDHSDAQGSSRTSALRGFSKHVVASQTVEEKDLPWQKRH